MEKEEIKKEKDHGIYIRLDDDHYKMLQFVAGIERAAKSEITRSILQPGLQDRYDIWMREFKKSL